MKKPLILLIMDGWGISPEKENNAIHIAKTPNIDRLSREYPYCELGASGASVGLPDGQMGNSEVGHLNLGAGRIVYQDFSLIDKAIETKTFFDNDELNAVCKRCEAAGKSLHVMGLLSDGGVHSHIRHLFAMLDVARGYDLKNVFIHAFLDGRDTPPRSSHIYLKQVLDYIKDDGNFMLASMAGRFYAMDRDTRWDRVKKAYDALLSANGRKSAGLTETIKECYERDETDEFVIPTIVNEYKGMEPSDGVVFFNFRADRAREITRAFTQNGFDGFDVSGNVVGRDDYVCFTEYDENFHLRVAFKPVLLKNILADEVSKVGLGQLRIAETEKYAHVTFFFNGGDEHTFKDEDRALIPSPKEVTTYDEKPEMSAYLVKEEVIKRIQTGRYDLIVLNFANADMVGHTGILTAAVKACEAVDECVGRVIDEIIKHGGDALITADHGNAEQMYDKKNDQPHTAHTTNPVPFIAVSKRIKRLKDCGILADVAPTILHLMGLDQPPEMSGSSLIEE
jgi:2,3-bisphosphoglycerate-independent phosphoglycerate mutase